MKNLLKIAKNRYSGDLGIMPLEFDKASLSYAQKVKKKPELSDLSGSNPQSSSHQQQEATFETPELS